MKKYFTAALLCCMLLLSACTTAEKSAANSTPQETSESPSRQPVQTEVAESGSEQPASPTLPDESTASQPHSEETNKNECRESLCDIPEDALQPSSPPESGPAMPEEPSLSTQPTEEYPLPSSEPTTPPEPVPEPQPEGTPAFDIQEWISFAQNYGLSVGLIYDSTATGCWDNPIIASSKSVYLERDIKSRLELYAADGITYFCVWAQLRTDGRYDLYIGYA